MFDCDGKCACRDIDAGNDGDDDGWWCNDDGGGYDCDCCDGTDKCPSYCTYANTGCCNGTDW